jgi:hypothetical protein
MQNKRRSLLIASLMFLILTLTLASLILTACGGGGGGGSSSSATSTPTPTIQPMGPVTSVPSLIKPPPHLAGLGFGPATN